MSERDRREWECPKCHEHFFQYVIDDGVPVCDRRDKNCPAVAAVRKGTQPSTEGDRT